MIASWMLYAVAISILITIAAFGLERVGQTRGYATRFVWVGALALSLLWPAWHVVARMLPESPKPASVLPFTIVVYAPAMVVDGSASLSRAELIDRALAVLWIAASLLLLARLVAAVRTVERSRAQWRAGSIDGIGVRLSENVGPAVVGLRSMDVVLPEWILSLDAPLRAIVLCHEEEHRAARDPYLLFAAAFAVVLMPWNLALWIQARRLRLAIEMDCDARVLRAHPSPERYGMLMLTIAQRRSVTPGMFAPMLSEPTTDLERRILAMRTKTKKLARVTMYGGGVIAVATLAFASTLQSAPSFSSSHFLRTQTDSPPSRSERAARDTQTVRTLATVVTSAVTDANVPPSRAAAESAAVMRAMRRQQVNPAPRYPDVMLRAELEGSVAVRFNTDAEGIPDSSSIEVLSSTHQLLTNSVRHVLPRWHLAPNATIVMPFMFVLEGGKTLAAIRAGGGQATTVVGGVRTQSVLVVGVPAGAAVARPPSAAPVAPSAANPRSAPVAAGGRGAMGPPRRVTDSTTYFEFQVEQPATPMPGNRGPRYPDTLREAGVEGEVLAQFVVDTTGSADMNTFKVLKSTDTLFTNAVRGTLPAMRFNAAEVGGKKVKQLIQMPFQFNLSKR
jgi:bla regulator protein blaR1